MFTASGNRSASLHPAPTRFTRYKFARTEVIFSPAAGIFSGRSETKTRNDPSGENPGEESRHSPENEATTGSDHFPPLYRESRITPQAAVLRVKYKVFPSGE